MPSWKTLLRLTLIGAAMTAVWWFGPWRSIAHPPGVLVAGEPRQVEIPPRTLPEVAGWKLQAIAEYELRGRVLGTKTYYSGASADLVPIDVAIGWGRLSDSATLDAISLSMGNRFFFYEWKDHPPVAEAEFIRSVANNHVIAATDRIRKVIAGLRPGHLVHFRGYLVDATKPDEGNWLTSRRRDDRGKGACELFYVESAECFESAPGQFVNAQSLTSNANGEAVFGRSAAN